MSKVPAERIRVGIIGANPDRGWDGQPQPVSIPARTDSGQRNQRDMYDLIATYEEKSLR